MDAKLDHLVIAVDDLDAATRAYETLLARAPSWRGVHPALGTRNSLFRLGEAYVELLSAAPAGGPLADLVRESLRGRAERPFALALGVPDVAHAVRVLRERGVTAGDPAPGEGVDDASGRRRSWVSAFVDPAAVRGLRLLLIEHRGSPGALPPAPVLGDAAAAASAVDHVVVFSQDLAASLVVLHERLGLAESWRRDFPERGTRNVGLALGDAVLEVIMRTDRPPSAREDVLWGVAYRVPDVDAAVARLRAAGGEASDPRPGLASGTRVANVRWDRSRTLLLSGAASSLQE